MSVTLDELLMLAGRLDDSPGFDTPRERFRRFLIEYVTDARVARALIEQSEHLFDEQHHRALQDLVTLLGRSLGFETRFGTYLPLPGGLKYEGHWRSRAHLEILLEIRTNQTPGTDVDTLIRSLGALAATSASSVETRLAGLCVVTPLYTNRARLEEAAAAKPEFPIRVASLRALLSVADMVSAGQLKHEEVLRLVETGSPLDFVAELLDRFAHPSGTDDSSGRETPVEDAQPARGFWLATVAGDHAVTPEQFVEVVIGRRHIFGVSADAKDAARPGDWICFYISGRGVVGRAEIASIEQNATGLRDAHQYGQLLRLENTALHLSAPIVPDFETQLRLRAVRGPSAPWQSFMRLTERDFLALTKPKENQDPEEASSTTAESTNRADATRLAVSAADLPSPE